MRATTWKRQNEQSRFQAVVHVPSSDKDDPIKLKYSGDVVEVFVDEVGSLCVFDQGEDQRTIIYAPGQWTKVEIELMDEERDSTE